MDIDTRAPTFQPRDLWPDYTPTDLIELPALAERAGVARVLAKLESQRPLGNFKSLGGFVASLRALARQAGVDSMDGLRRLGPALPPLICASEGNHGLSVAAAARFAGTRAIVYLPGEVSPRRAARIEAYGADVIRIEGAYDAAVRIAEHAAHDGAGLLIPDTSDDPDDIVVADVMDGYSLIDAELVAQLRDSGRGGPSHVFVQAGVGSLAAAIARGAGRWPDPARVLTVEPDNAACVAAALAAGRPQRLEGDLLSDAIMLSCGMASAMAVRVLLEHGAGAVTVTGADLEAALATLARIDGPATTASGAAGIAGLLRVSRDPGLRARHGLDATSCVLVLITEHARPDEAPPLTAAPRRD